MRLESATWRVLWAVFAVCAVVLGGIMVPAAQAQEDSADTAIEFGEIAISRFEQGEKKPNETIHQWDQVIFEVPWSAPNGVVLGQQFTIGFPEAFQLFASESFPLTDSSKHEFGVCDVLPGERVVSCRLDERAEPFLEKENISGVVSAVLQSSLPLSSREVVMRLNDTERPVQLPGDGEGVAAVEDTLPPQLEKWGWYEHDQVLARWSINIPGEDLVKWSKDKGSQTIKVTDTLGGYKHIFSGEPTITEYEYSVLPDGRWLQGDEVGASHKIDGVQINNDTLSMSVVPPNNSAWNEKHYYRIQYESKTADGKLAPLGKVTTNKAKLLGKEIHAIEDLQRKQSPTATIRGAERESYSVSAALAEGTDPTLIPETTKFDVHAEITRPDGQHSTEVVSVRVGDTVNGLEKLPVGSIVELSLPKPPAPAGAFVDRTAFSAGANVAPEELELLDDGQKVRFTIAADRNIAVVLTITVGTGDAPFVVVNRTAGVQNAREKEFEFSYVCVVDGKEVRNTLTALGDAVPVVSEKLPLGTVCEVVQEEKAATIDGYNLVADPHDLKQTITITPEPNIAQALFVNTYAQMTGSLAITKNIGSRGLAQEKSTEEFAFEASWSLNGILETRKFTLRHGDVYTDFPKLPLGTKITVKEILPADSVWGTPVIQGSVGGAVDDHGDGTAVATVLADTAGMLVTVTNTVGGEPAPTSDAAGWLGLLGFLPFLSDSSDSTQSGGNAVSTSVPRTPSPEAQGQATGGATSDTASKVSNLARTGASVMDWFIVAFVLGLLGIVFLRNSYRR